jgi:hypothetical protein
MKGEGKRPAEPEEELREKPLYGHFRRSAKVLPVPVLLVFDTYIPV